MPFFFDPLLVFLHIPKNAGRSIEDAFLPPHDNIDWGRPNILNAAAKSMLTATHSQTARRHMVGTQDITVAAQHLTYAEMELLGLLPADQPEAVFCICRNPFDRAVSSVTHFMGSQETPEAFERALEHWLSSAPADHNQRAHRRTQLSYILDSRGKSAVTDTLRFETLESDFRKFTARIGAPDIQLPWRGKASRSRDLAALYTPRARAMVQSSFGEDLDHFGYGFGD